VPFTGGVLIGPVRSKTCLLAYASPKITFPTVQAREHTTAGTAVWSPIGGKSFDLLVLLESSPAVR